MGQNDGVLPIKKPQLQTRLVPGYRQGRREGHEGPARVPDSYCQQYRCSARLLALPRPDS